MKPIEIGKRGVKKINSLVKSGILYRDKNGCVCGLPEYIDSLPELETHEIHISRKFLNELARKGVIVFDEKNRVFWMETLIVDLIGGKTMKEIKKVREKESKEINSEFPPTPRRRR